MTVVKVKAHTRKTSTGKIVSVKASTRSLYFEGTGKQIPITETSHQRFRNKLLDLFDKSKVAKGQELNKLSQQINSNYDFYLRLNRVSRKPDDTVVEKKYAKFVQDYKRKI